MAAQETQIVFTPSSHALAWTGEPLTAGAKTLFRLYNEEHSTNPITSAATLTLVIKPWREPTQSAFILQAGWTDAGSGQYTLEINTAVATWLAYMNSAISRPVEVELWDMSTSKILGYDDEKTCYRSIYRDSDVATDPEEFVEDIVYGLAESFEQDFTFSASTYGPVLVSRTSGTEKRIWVSDNGHLATENASDGSGDVKAPFLPIASWSADTLPYLSGADAASTTTLTAYARTLLDDADAATARTTLGLVIGTDVQAWSARLDDIAALAVTDDNIIVGDGSNWVAESGATARTSLGFGAATTGNLLLGDGTDFAALTIGASGYVLQSNGTTASWVSPGGGGISVSQLDASDGAPTGTLVSGADGSLTTGYKMTHGAQIELSGFQPADATAANAMLYLNSTDSTMPANARLISVNKNGSELFYVDEDGDAMALDRVGASNGQMTMGSSGGYGRYLTVVSGGHAFRGDSVGSDRVTMGVGAYAQRTLGSALDQDDVTIKRDVDGASAHSEAGSLLHLWRDVTNTPTPGGTGNFLEWSTDGSTPLGYIGTTGAITTPGATSTAQLEISGFQPADATAANAMLYINSTDSTMPANARLVSVNKNGSELFYVDEDGDVRCNGTLAIKAGSCVWSANSSYSQFSNAYSNGYRFTGTDIGDARVTMGAGNDAQETLGAALDQDDVTIKRDVDGASTHSEAGSLLHLWRDVTNTPTPGGTGNFLEWSTDGSTALGYIDKAGQLRLDANQQYGNTTGVGWGDDSRLYETADDILKLDIGGSPRVYWTTGAMRSETNFGFHIRYLGGSASEPDYTFAGDTDTGVFRPTGDQLGFSAGGVELLRLTEGATDYVEVGTPGGTAVKVTSGGDVSFEGAGSGLQYGSIFGVDQSTTFTCTVQNTWYQLTMFDTNGPSNGCTSDHTNDHITISEAGDYKVGMACSFSGSNSATFELQVFKNNGATACPCLIIRRKLGAAGDVGCVAVNSIATFAANDTIELWARCTDGASKDIVPVHTSLNLIQIGGD